MTQNKPFGQKTTSKWFAMVPKWLRYLIIFGGLIMLVYFSNKGIWF
ncbi:hypothetical protein [Virgibacillus doumboii]|nr:hypothetical protein [Virgibacillus doumboii]